jgi:hypothetical protein
MQRRDLVPTPETKGGRTDMADKPDLSGKVFGLKEALPGDPCFDPLQPWFVNFVVKNVGLGSAGPFSVRMETYEKGTGFDIKKKLIGWVEKTFEMPASFDFVLGPQQVVSADYRLPVGIAHTDFGSKFPFFFIIDPDNEVGEPDATRENNVVLTLETPPILAGGPPPPPDPWDVGAAAIIGEKNAVVAKIRNQGTETLAGSTVELVLRIPRPGAPTGKPEVAGSAKVPSLKPGAQTLVKIAAKRNFIQAVVEPEKRTKGVSKTGAAAKKTSPVGPSKRGTGLEKQGRLLVTQTTRFQVLIPFSLRVKGADSELGFGGPSASSKSGKIKFPGKK